MVFKLSENGKYGRPEVYSDEDTVKVGIFKDFEIDMKNEKLSSGALYFRKSQADGDECH